MGGLYALNKGEQALVALKFGKSPEGVWHQRLVSTKELKREEAAQLPDKQ
jgi:hypothetical protein